MDFKKMLKDQAINFKPELTPEQIAKLKSY